MKNALCIALGAVLGATAAALAGAKVLIKSIDDKKELCDKYVSEKAVAEMLSNISDPEELKEYVLRLRQALMTDDETDMEELLVELSKYKPTKQTSNADDEDEDDFIIDPDIQVMLDGMDIKLSEVFEGLNQQYEDISDKINFICNLFTEDEDDESDEEWKELEVEAPENSSNESSEESLSSEANTVSTSPESEPENSNEEQVSHESAINMMTDSVISPLCSKYGEDLRQPLEESICRLVDCGNTEVVDAYFKKFASAVRSSRGSKKQIQKYINEIKKLPTQGSTSAE